MSKIKAFGYIYYKSITSIKYYRDVLKAEFSFSFKYFATIAVIASLIITAVASVEIYPEVTKGIDELLDKATTVYPEDLVITSSEGTWSINQEEPYAIELPIDPKTWIPEQIEGASEEEMAQMREDAYFPKTLVVFDHEGEINDMEEYDTLVLINDANVLIRDAQKVEAYPLGELPEGEFTQATFMEMVRALENIAKYIPSLVIVLIFAATLFAYFVVRAISLVFVALVVWIMAAIAKNKISFGKAYQLSIHTMTLPLTIQMLIAILNIPFYIPLWFFLVNVIFGTVVVFGVKNSGSGQVPIASPAENSTEKAKTDNTEKTSQQ